MTFFSALPYTPKKATPHFVEVCFRFVQTTVFRLLFSLLHNLCQIFINAYKLYFILVHNFYFAHENIDLVTLHSSVSCYPLPFLKYRA